MSAAVSRIAVKSETRSGSTCSAQIGVLNFGTGCSDVGPAVNAVSDLPRQKPYANQMPFSVERVAGKMPDIEGL